MLAQDALNDCRDICPLRGIDVGQNLLFAELQRIPDLHDPRLVDAADADVLVNLLVDLPHLRRLRDEVVAVEGRCEQDVELRRLRLHGRIGIETEGHRNAGPLPHVGEIGKALLVGNPELVEHGLLGDLIQNPVDAGRVVSGGFSSFHEIGGDARLRRHRAVERRV